MQTHPFARDPDEEHFQGYTGNEGATATYLYHGRVSDSLLPLALFKQAKARFLSKHIQDGLVFINSWMKRFVM